MNTPVLTRSGLSRMLFERVRQSLQSSAAGEGCGLLIASVRPMEGIQLDRLEKRLRLESPGLTAIASYEADDQALVMLLPGQTLAFTHFLSISVKAHLQDEGLLAGRLAVTGFTEDEPVSEPLLEAFAARWSEASDGDQDIAVFAGTQPASPEPPTVVMIDSNKDLLDFMNVRLGMQGYDVRPAQDGMEGLQLIESVRPDLVITELKLPALDGYQLIDRIRHSRKHPGCKVVVLTDLGVERDICQCFELGASDVIKKPFSPRELEARIRRLLA
ncbi:Sensor histidine kinase RcsC [Paenibacillus solanacearum]|uniref:Sensor histidine kinase RcsC n=1 Tax=Paenibacillus solanacearum TaxID=2048548 RepID=A0A916NQS7_9BACL|nr:response regulator [Paenibacillus solanacearum]CAG7641149.1 Sensor histidine kinase RcsC [Paenibacillus solanacearum]